MSRIIHVGTQNDIKDAPKPDHVTELGLHYAVLKEIPDRGLHFGRGRVPSGGMVPSHAADNDYALFVLSGSGFLTLFDVDENEVDRLAFQPGDLIMFPPKADHGWINESDTDFEWFGVDIASSQ